MVKVVNSPIDPVQVFDSLKKNSSGSVLLHYAMVKHDMGPDGTKKTNRIEYQENGDVPLELKKIEKELEAGWQVEDVVLMLRVGCLSVHDIISLVAVSSPNSKDAFAACQNGIQRMKKMATIVKKEYFG